MPDENVFPEVSTLRGPLSCLNEARYGIVWGAVGAGRACFEAALDYAKERIVFEQPIAAYQLTQQKLAEMALELNRGLLVALHIGRMKDDGTLRQEHVSLGKMGNVRGAIEVARSARTILGANGVTLEYPVIRHVNNLESVLTYEGTHEVHTLVVGGALTGENAFRYPLALDLAVPVVDRGLDPEEAEGLALRGPSTRPSCRCPDRRQRPASASSRAGGRARPLRRCS